MRIREPKTYPTEGIPEGHIWIDDEGGIMTMHYWHRWFAWRPVFLVDHGWVWLRCIERRFSTRSRPDRLTFAPQYRLIGSGSQLADANQNQIDEAEHG